MEGVRGDAGTEEPCQWRGPAGLGVFFGFDDHHRAGFAEDESVAVFVERPGGGRRIVVAGRHRTHHRERGDGQCLDHAFDATADRDIGITHDELPPGVGDGLRTGRARRHRGDDPGPRAKVKTDDGRSAIGHDHLNRERRNLADAALVHHVVGLDDLLATAKTGADHYGESVRIDLGGAGGVPHLAAEVLRHALDIGHPSQIQSPHVVVDRIDEMPADPNRQIPLGDEVVLEDPDSALPGQQGLPRAVDIRAECRGRLDGGHHDIREAAVSSGRLAHWSEPNFSRSAAAASGFSCSSFWM